MFSSLNTEGMFNMMLFISTHISIRKTLKILLKRILPYTILDMPFQLFFLVFGEFVCFFFFLMKSSDIIPAYNSYNDKCII